MDGSSANLLKNVRFLLLVKIIHFHACIDRFAMDSGERLFSSQLLLQARVWSSSIQYWPHSE